MSYKILKVEVRGFKSHMDSTFEYAPGLTVVTGPTDTGKSGGVMQPIKWVAFGEPEGEAFLFTIRDEVTKEIIRQADGAEVIITMDSGLTIRKTRRKGKTAWYLGDMEKPISEKAEVPDEVKAALGLTKQKYGDFETSLNFAYQLEAPFLLSETPSVGAKVLGKLAGTEVVDKAIGAISKQVHKARDDKAAAVKAIDQSNVGLIEYLHLDEIIEQVEASEASIILLDRSASLAAHIRQLQGRYEVLDEGLVVCTSKLKQLEAVVPEMVRYMIDIDAQMLKADALYPAYVKYLGLDEQAGQIASKIKLLEVVPEAVALIEKITTAYTAHIALYTLVGVCYSLKGRLDALELKLGTFSSILEASELLAETESTFLRGNEIALLNYQFSTTSKDIAIAEGKLAKCKALPDAVVLLAKVEKDFTRLEALRALSNELARKDLLLNSASVLQDSAAREKVSADEELQEAWEETGGECPLCGQSVVHTH